MSHQTFHHIGWRGRVSDGKGGGRCGRTYELDEDAYIDVFKGSRQFDPLVRFHAPIAAAKSANRQGLSLSSLFPKMDADGKVRGRETQARARRRCPIETPSRRSPPDLDRSQPPASAWCTLPRHRQLPHHLYSTSAAHEPYSDLYAPVRD